MEGGKRKHSQSFLFKIEPFKLVGGVSQGTKIPQAPSTGGVAVYVPKLLEYG